MAAVRLSRGDARKLGLRLPRQPSGAIYLPDLVGPPSLALQTERHVQRTAIAVLLPALPPGSKAIHFANERTVGHLEDASQRAILGALRGDGMTKGVHDTEWIWDLTLGAPGNRGLCWIEFKKPINPKPVSPEQVAWRDDMAALGITAGWAQSDWQAEDLLIRAGAPLSRRILRPAWATAAVS